MLDFNLYLDLTHQSLFNNTPCILFTNFNNYILLNDYNIFNDIYSINLVYNNYFILSKQFWITQTLNLTFLYSNLNMYVYSIYNWKYNLINIINEFVSLKYNINYYQLNIAWIFLQFNWINEYLIINKLPKISNNTHLINFFFDKQIFPFKYDGLYFYYKHINLNYTYINRFFLINNVYYITYWNKANIFNYLILNNNYLLSFFLKNHWYNNNFKVNGYLYYTMPLYWDYDYILGINKFLDYINLYDNLMVKPIVVVNNYYARDLIINTNIVELQFIFLKKFLMQNWFIINIIVILKLIYLLIYIIYYYMNYIFSFIKNWLNWFLNILTFCFTMKIQDYLFFYLFNPLYLYFGKNMREIIYWYCDIINKKNLNLIKNKKDCDSNILIFYYDFVNQSFIKYLTYLLIFLIFKYIYIFIHIFTYNIKYLIKYNIIYLSFISLILNYYNFISTIINLKHFLSKNLLKSIWMKLNYIYLEIFNFSHQNKLISNSIFISIINWFNFKELNIFNYNQILNKIEYNHNIKYWKNLYLFIHGSIKLSNSFKLLNLFLLNISIIKNIFVNNQLKKKFIFINKWNFFDIKSFINNCLFLLGLNIFFFLDIINFIIKWIIKIIINILYKYKYLYFIIFIIIIIFFNFNLKLIILPLELLCVYEFSWINQLIYWIYNKEYFFFSEWIIYENKFIWETIKIKCDLLKLKENIWNDIFVHINFQKKKWQNVTEEKLWNFINPIYFLIFLIYELQIQWFINEIIHYIYISIIIKIIFNYLPFLYWFNLNYTYKYLLNFIILNFKFFIYLLKCYYSYIYIYIPSYFLGKNISTYIYYNLHYIYIIKLNYFWINNVILNNVFKFLYINIYIYLKFYIYNIFLISYNHNIYNYKIINNILSLILLDYYKLLIYNIIYFDHIYSEYINFFVYINIFIEIQNNIDIMNSYIRINKYKLYQWNKFSKKKKSYRYFIKSVLIEYFFSPTYEDNLITLTSIIKDNSFNRTNIINYWTNINIYIKYWYWILNNYYKNILLGFGSLYYWEESLNIYEIDNIYEEDTFFILLNKYNDFWNFSWVHYKFLKLNIINNFYINQFNYFYKNFFIWGKLYLNSFLNYIYIYMLNIFFLFTLVWKNLNKNFFIDYNVEVLWKNLKNLEKSNNLNNINDKINNWVNIIFKKKIKSLYQNKLITPIFINYYYNLIILNYNNLIVNKFNILNFKIKYIKYFFLFKIKKNIWYNNIYTKYNLTNRLINILNINKNNNFKNLYNRYSEITYLLISYLYKKNSFANLINKQELYKLIIPLNKNYYTLNFINVQLQKNLNIYILQMFNQIDKVIFNNGAPKWLLNVNNSTPFYNYSLNDKKEILEMVIKFPYEFYYFFINIIFIYIYYKVIIYGLNWNQKYWIGANIFEKREIFNLLIYNIFWIDYIKFLNQFDNINSSLINTNSNYGIFLQQLTNIFISTNKYYFFNNLFNYKNKLNVYMYYFQLKDQIFSFDLKNYKLIQWLYIKIYILIFLYFIGFKIIYNNYGKYLILNIKYLPKNYKINLNLTKFKFIYFHYKFKKMLWNNRIKNGSN